eukprot:TRINITY_DN4860_c0_g3_i1.p1 TRINITY_DN4860_c0_g3~~TRINITY_DN4860_c0_g3_i1.p1  ORF type:complete len:108 (-),score=25.86 TRINITY_DN4860_c0_g3_i1:120-443(-)
MNKIEQQTLAYRLQPHLRPYPFPRLLMWNFVAFVGGVSIWSLSKAYFRELYWDEHPGKLVPAKWPHVYFGRWEYYADLTDAPDMRSAVLPPEDPDRSPIIGTPPSRP